MLARVRRWLRRLTPPYRDRGESVWELIPGRQYDGRHAESGGLTRWSQERSLAEIQEEADRRDQRR